MKTLETASVIAVASVCIVLSIIPSFPIIGAQGVITLGALSGVVIGLFLGVEKGFFATVLVAIAILLLNPGLLSILGPLYYLPIMLGYLGSSIFFYRSPVLSLLASIISPILAFVLVNYPLITHYWSFIIYDLATPFTILFLVLISKNTGMKHDIRLLGAVVTGVLADHIGGSLAFTINYLYLQNNIAILISNSESLSNWATIFNTVAYIYPVERTILIIIGYALLKTVYVQWKHFILDKIK